MINPRLVDVHISTSGHVELIFEDRRITFTRDGDRPVWAIASKPPNPRDGSGVLDDDTTSADVVNRGLRSVG